MRRLFNMSLSLKGILLVTAPSLIMFGFLGMFHCFLELSEQQTEIADQAKRQAEKTKEKLRLVDDLDRTFIRAGGYLFLYKNAHSVTAKASCEQQLSIAQVECAELGKLLMDDPVALNRFQHAKELIQRGDRLTRHFLWHLDHPQEETFANYTNFEPEMRMLTKEYVSDLDAIVGKERALSTNMQNDAQVKLLEEQAKGARAHIKDLVLAAGGVIILVGIVFTHLFNKSIVAGLNTLMDNARRLASRSPLNAPLNGNDEIAQLDLVFRQMADSLTAAAARERAIVDNAADVICSVGNNLVFTDANPSVLAVWGYTSEELIGQRIISIIYEEDQDLFHKMIDETRTSKITSKFECRVLRKSKSAVHMLWSAKWSPADGTFFCVAHDISERKEIEQLKQDFLGMISHELRTPLTSLQGTLTMLQKGFYGPLSEAGLNRVRNSELSVQRLINLINELLDVERLEAGKLTMHFADADLHEIIERSIEAVRGFAELQKVEIEASAPSTVPMSADADRLIQVMVNLLSNAIKFSPKNEIVRIVATPSESSVMIEIIDNGRGIPEKYRHTVFDRYVQVEASDGSNKKGTGLGLAICKAIVEEHGGSIGVDSTPGKGSTFWLKLPIYLTLEE